MLYELENLKMTFGQRTVLDIDALSLEEGKVLGILGPNGAGKTSLLEILAFLQTPTSGELRFNGKRVNFNANALIHLRRKVVIVGQHPILFTTTVSKNLEFPLGIRKLPNAKREMIIEELLELTCAPFFSGLLVSEGALFGEGLQRNLLVAIDDERSEVDLDRVVAKRASSTGSSRCLPPKPLGIASPKDG